MSISKSNENLSTEVTKSVSTGETHLTNLTKEA